MKKNKKNYTESELNQACQEGTEEGILRALKELEEEDELKEKQRKKEKMEEQRNRS
ncbi:MAG: hypothetical protein U5L76_05800 [Patescibacteria group bacterium]|nr:hypothetical protein [Patescibacteria group bacterium]MDZ7799080.1 hypothetical protein [Patescibacteria group bacterium]